MVTRAHGWVVFGIVYLLFLLTGLAALAVALGLFPDALPSFKEYAVAVAYTTSKRFILAGG